MGKAPASVIGLAADVTTPFLFLAVYMIRHTIFGEGPVFTLRALQL